jgi:hypothetical protein
MYTLSKSDYKLACSCPKKLQYKKNGYPSNLQTNEFMKMLAEGGYVVGKLAQLIYPGYEISESDTSKAVEITKSFLCENEVTLHEATIKSGDLVARIDILKKSGNHFQLIEVKSKSFNSKKANEFKRKANGQLNSDTKEYIKDAIFQTIVLQRAYPNSIIDTYLLMPDKTSFISYENITSIFNVKTQEPNKINGFTKVEVTINENILSDLDKIISTVCEDKILKLLNINNEVKEYQNEVLKEVDSFLSLLKNDFKNYNPVLNKECKKCEFTVTDSSLKDGFKECWGISITEKSMVWDIYKAGSIKDNFLNKKIVDKQYLFANLTKLDFTNEDEDISSVGNDNKRRIIQFENTISNTEFPYKTADKLNFKRAFNDQFKYPLYFIDFETMSSPIPFHKNLSPYDMFPFQWSLHIVDGPFAEPKHYQYLNTEDGYPGFRFAETLMEKIGDQGTPLMWSKHENTTLNNVLRHMDFLGYENTSLKQWLENMTSKMDDKNKKYIRKGRLVDMNEFALRYYFHPDMKGRTSIKLTLPAIWMNNNYLHNIPWFKDWVHTINGEIVDPYDKLKLETLQELWGENINFNLNDFEESFESSDYNYSVKDGGAAMKAYRDMMSTPDVNKRKRLSMQLLKYCELDTLAMVIIYTHWQKIANK